MKSLMYGGSGCAASVAATHWRRMPRRVSESAATPPVAIARCADHRGSTPAPVPAFASSIIASVSMMNETRAGARPAGVNSSRKTKLSSGALEYNKRCCSARSSAEIHRRRASGDAGETIATISSVKSGRRRSRASAAACTRIARSTWPSRSAATGRSVASDAMLTVTRGCLR